MRLHGYRIIQKNFTTNFGELDIIAQKNNVVVIVEVKSRYFKSDWHPLSSIDKKKQAKIKKLSKYYILYKDLQGVNLRIDAITLQRKFVFFVIKHYKNIF